MPVSNQPVASVVIPTFNRAAHLPSCLDRLHRCLELCPGAGVEVVLSDDSPNADTAELVAARYPWVQWVRGPRGGPARNRNCGVAHSRGRWIIFLDDDCLPAERWLPAYLEGIAAGDGIGVFEGCTVADREPQRLDEEAPVNTAGGVLWSCNMAVERDLYDRLGGFCEDFPLPRFEDSDFSQRIRRAGAAVRFLPEAVVCHPRRPVRGLAFQWASVESFLLLAQRNPEVLGDASWRTAVLNLLRRVRQTLRAAGPVRFRGFGYAVGAVMIQTYAEIRAIAARRWSAG
jgi:GT2 family glycosyltransferase